MFLYIFFNFWYVLIWFYISLYLYFFVFLILYFFIDIFIFENILNIFKLVLYIFDIFLCMFLYWNKFSIILIYIFLFSSQDKLQKRIASCKKRVEEVQEDSDDVFLASAQEQLERWQNRKRFFDMLTSMNLFPIDVRADGSCALWSLAAIMAGFSAQSNLCTSEKILEMREDRKLNIFLCKLYILKSNEIKISDVLKTWDLWALPSCSTLALCGDTSCFFWRRLQLYGFQNEKIHNGKLCSHCLAYRARSRFQTCTVKKGLGAMRQVTRVS